MGAPAAALPTGWDGSSMAAVYDAIMTGEHDAGGGWPR